MTRERTEAPLEVVEQQVVGKDPERNTCEDVIVTTADFTAVIDGATDKAGIDFDGRTGGLLAAEAVRDALLELDREAELPDLVRLATSRLVGDLGSSGVEVDILVDDGPSASFVVYSSERREVWRVGDCSWLSEAGTFPGGKAIDSICANARSALLHALLEDGVSEAELLARDPGREMVMPLLRNQHVFRNLADSSSDLVFGAIDGREVPERFLEVWPIGDARELVLASDGYPELKPTLTLSEEALADDLAKDPLRIGTHASTKGVVPGQRSFDDRAYLRIETRT